MRATRRWTSRCRGKAGAFLSIRRRRSASSPTPTRWKRAPLYCSSKPGSETELVRMGEELVPREDAHAVIEPSSKRGLQVNAKAVLAVRGLRGRLELVGM